MKLAGFKLRKAMRVTSIKTHLIKPAEPLIPVLDRYITSLPEKTVLAVTSKIVSLSQNRLVSKSSVESKYQLVKAEADAYLPEGFASYGAHLTIKNKLLIPSAGIDESNAKHAYILYPENIQKTAYEVWMHLRKEHNINELGVIITDSHVSPLRRGVTGITLGWCGFEPLHNYIGKPDLFGAPLRITQINLLDALAAAAVLNMGEGAEQTPFALVNEIPKLVFLNRPPSAEEESDIFIDLADDLYAPLLNKTEWIWK